MIYLIADQHYHHRNIIRYAARPFACPDEMDEAMVSLHNATVGEGDLVYHLGDFAFGNVPQISKTLAGLHGVHILIKGNHDRGPEAMRDCGFAAVLDSAVVSFLGEKLRLTHRPMVEIPRLEILGVVHGHIHNGTPHDLAEAGEPPRIPCWNLNLCVEVTDYRPLSARVVVKRLKWQLKNNRMWEGTINAS